MTVARNPSRHPAARLEPSHQEHKAEAKKAPQDRKITGDDRGPGAIETPQPARKPLEEHHAHDEDVGIESAADKGTGRA